MLSSLRFPMGALPRAVLAGTATLVAHHALAEEQSPHVLEAVTVVSAAGFEQHIADAPASISVIDREQLETKSYTDVTDALKDIPGVTVTGGGSRQDISLRGMSPKYTMILVDGRRLSGREATANGNDSGLEQNYLPPLRAIERIEVIRGPMSSLYGSEAMGGVINIITRKVPEQWLGSFGAEATLQDNSKSGNARQSDLYLAGPLLKDKLGLQVNGQVRHRDEDEILEGFEEQKVRGGGAKLVFTPDQSNEIGLSYQETRQERNGSPGKYYEEGSEPSNRRFDKEVAALTHNGNFGNWSTDSYIQNEKTENPDRVGELRNGITLETLTANTQATWFGERHIITAGAQYKDEELTDYATNRLPTSSSTEISRWQYAVFLEDEWRLTNDLSLTGGLRFNQDENFGDHVSPRLYAVYHLNPALTLKGGVSTGYRQPSLREAADDWGSITGGGGYPAGHPRAIIKGNPDLDPETSINYEMGLALDLPSGFATSVMLFQTDFKDKITEYRECDNGGDRNDPSTWSCDYEGQTYMFVSDRINVDEAQMQGVEATLAWHLTPAVLLNASYTFTDSEQKTGEFKGEPLNKIPRHMINAGIDWQTTDRLQSWVRVNHRSRTSDYQSRTSMADGTPGYSMVDLGLNYRASEHLTLKAGVYNVGDRQVTNADYEMVLDGRRYTAGLVVDF